VVADPSQLLGKGRAHCRDEDYHLSTSQKAREDSRGSEHRMGFRWANMELDFSLDDTPKALEGGLD
jgi:hypothetical protein